MLMNQEHEDERYTDDPYEVCEVVTPRASRGAGRLQLAVAGLVVALVLWLMFRGMYLAGRELVHFL